jgi:hypothetical protein
MRGWGEEDFFVINVNACGLADTKTFVRALSAVGKEAFLFER